MAYSGVGGNVVKHILPTFSEAVNMVDDEFSSFVRKTSTRHITLPPKYLGRLKAGVNDIINADLGLYSDRLDGVMIAFSNLKMCKPTGTIMDDQSTIHFDIQLDEIIFKPTIGCWLKGVVNKKGENYIGCLVHSCFNASIPKPKHQMNGWRGFELELGDEFVFCVTRLESAHDVLSIAGVLSNDSGKKYDLADGAMQKVQMNKVKRKSSLKKKSVQIPESVEINIHNIKTEVESDTEQQNRTDIMDNVEHETPSKQKSKKAKKRRYEDPVDSDQSENSFSTPAQKIIKQEVGESSDEKRKKHKKHKKHKINSE